MHFLKFRLVTLSLFALHALILTTPALAQERPTAPAAAPTVGAGVPERLLPPRGHGEPLPGCHVRKLRSPSGGSVRVCERQP